MNGVIQYSIAFVVGLILAQSVYRVLYRVQLYALA